MDQRRLRLGDILDDYCPRERRVTNHAVVAMIEDEVKQTRCTTCEAEHVYKGARLPKRRTKDAPATLYKEVLAGMPEPESAPAPAVAAHGTIVDVPDQPPAIVEAASPNDEPKAVVDRDDAVADHEPEMPSQSPVEAPVEDGPVHRQLLRAKLPRPEGQKDARPLPEFTVRQSGGRGNGHFRGDRKLRGGAGDPRSMSGRGNGGPVNGNRAGGDGRSRFSGSRPGQHRNPGRGGSPNPFRGGPPRHGGKKGRG
jgi:hypothetical protein